MSLTICIDSNNSCFSPWYSYDNPGVSNEADLLNKRNIEISLEQRNNILFINKSSRLEEVFKETQLENWDGYNAEPILYKTYLNALRLLSLLPVGIEDPEIAPEPDGDISIEWQKSRTRIFSISVGVDGRLTYVGFYGKSRAKGVEYLDEELPQSILSNIKRIILS